MKSLLSGLFPILAKIRTPLTLAGLAVLILYALYEKVLSLGIYSNVGSQATANIISNILSKVFWLAVLALVLGVASYLTTTVLSWWNPSIRSKLELVDASVDPNMDLNRNLSEAKPASTRRGRRSEGRSR